MAKENESEEFIDMRCKACGVYMGVRRRSGRFIFYCSEECGESVMTKNDTDQIRDEVACELYLAGAGVVEIARICETNYQMVQHILARRGIPLYVNAKEEEAS
jgi:predicted HTH domain antitoxin